MKVYLLIGSFLAALLGVSLAGRAFPQDSENFVTQLFQDINPRIEWDPTNFLVDLSGQYSLCKYLYETGHVKVERRTKDGGSIGGIREYDVGAKSDASAVKQYLRSAMFKWMTVPTYIEQIMKADYFGCSVQPGCNGYISIACLFSPEYVVGGEVTDKPLNLATVSPHARAFTPEQYFVAESILKQQWDRSHVLENLSGVETQCAMIGMEYYSFPDAKQQASARGMYIEGIIGSAVNNGDTERAMVEIMESDKWQQEFKKIRSRNVGCSLIPDCFADRRMYVVISCLYEE